MTIYDPKVEDAQIWLDLSEALPSWPIETIKKHVNIARSALEACKQKEGIVIATEWKEFKEINWRAVYDQMSKPAFVFDGRMILDVEELQQIGFTVRLDHSFRQIPSAFAAPVSRTSAHACLCPQVKVIGRGDRL